MSSKTRSQTILSRDYLAIFRKSRPMRRHKDPLACRICAKITKTILRQPKRHTRHEVYAHTKRRSTYWHYLVIALMLFSANFYVAPAGAGTTKCNDLEFIFARGSGEELHGPSETAWRTEVEKQVADLGLTYNFYELGQSQQGGYQYPAVAVAGGLGEIMNLLGAAVSGGSAFAFGDSVKQGVSELKARIAAVSKACPNTRFILGGYSQGAMIMSQTLPNLDPGRIIYVATFGDPKVYLPEGKSKSYGVAPKVPDACRGKNLSPYRIYVPDCFTFEGVLGSYRPYQPTGYLGKLGTWCNKNDIMCSSGVSIDDHTSYVSENLYVDAAQEILRAIQRVYDIKAPIAGAGMGTLHDVAIVIDTTASMSGVINQYKDEAKNLASRVLADGGRVALFEYRDLKENFQPRELCDFACSEMELIQKISQLKVSGGGDDPESSLSATMTALNSLDWQNGVTKSIVLLTDAGYHNPDIDGTTVMNVVQRSLEIDPVNIYVMTTRNNKASYAELTTLTNGAVFDIYDELTLSTQTILSRPVAMLALPEYRGMVNDEFTFDSSHSYANNSDELKFDWDLDGDGIFEIQDAPAAVKKTYSQPFDGYIQVKAHTDSGSNTMSAHVVATSSLLSEETPAIRESHLEWLSPETAQISFRSNAAQVLLFLNGAPLGRIQVKDGQAQITLTDLQAPAVATLVPYSTTNRRGISETVALGADNVSGSAGSIGVLGDAVETVPDTSPSIFIPKVPNSGVVQKSYFPNQQHIVLPKETR